MVRTLALAALACSGCTLIVDHQLSKHESGGCPELVFLDGVTPTSGQTFHQNVSAPAFRGPAYPPASKGPDNFGSTLAFIADGGLELVGGNSGDQVFLRSESNWTPTWAVPAPGHEGPGAYGCAEVLAGTYDSLHDRTNYQLIPGGCGDDGVFYDGGSFPGLPDPQGPALAWAAAPDGGGQMAVLFGNRAQVCGETFPLSCFPPQGGAVTVAADRHVDALTDASGNPVWMVSIGGGDTRLYDTSFGASLAVTNWAGPVAALASDIGVAMRLDNGVLEAQLFDSTGADTGPPTQFQLGDATAHGLQIARLGTAPIVRAAWIGGDERARVAAVDFSTARLSAPVTVCGSQGASFVAPTSTTTAAVIVGDALYLRHVDYSP